MQLKDLLRKEGAHPTSQLLADFGTGSIDDDSVMVEIEQHLSTCQLCAEYVAGLAPHDSEAQLADALAGSNWATAKLVGRYQILEEIGRGGLGIVYKAWQADLNRVLALKVLISGSRASAEELARFRREAWALAQINHPQIVRVHDFGEQDGAMFLAMEYVDGPTLAQRLMRGPIETRTAALWVRDLARAIAYANERSIYHRDLKPHNILLARDGAGDEEHRLVPKIVDFGLAKFEREELFHTKSGETLGTPAYLAPEMVGKQADQPVSSTVDVYGLGTILYECLAGRPPFTGSSTFEILSAVMENEPAAVQSLRGNVPRDLAIICHRCLAKNPEKRFASAAELADDLDRVLDGTPIHSRPVSFSEKTLRWCQRNPWKAIAAGLFFLLVLAMPAAGIYHNSQLRNEKRFAQQRYETARATVWAMLNLVNDNRAQSIPQIAELSEAQVAESLNLFDELAAVDPSGQSQLDAAKVRIQAGSLAVVLGKWEKAEGHLGQAIAVCEKWIDSPEFGKEAAEQLAAALNKQSFVHLKKDDVPKRIALLERALSIHRDLAQRNGNDLASRGRVAWSLINLGSVYQASQDYQKAMAMYEEALQICSDLIGEEYQTAETRKMASGCRINLATIQLQLGDTQSAEGNFRSAIEDQEARFQEASGDKALVEDLSSSLLNYSNCLQANGQTADAIAACERARDMLLDALKLEPNRFLLKQNLFLVTANRAHLLTINQRFAEAVPAWQAAVALAADPSMATYCRQMGNICLTKSGDFERAVSELKLLDDQIHAPNEKFLQALGWALIAKVDCGRDQIKSEPPTEETRQYSCDRAWKFLNELKAAGQLATPNYQGHLQTENEWSELRNRLGLEVWNQLVGR